MISVPKNLSKKHHPVKSLGGGGGTFPYVDPWTINTPSITLKEAQLGGSLKNITFDFFLEIASNRSVFIYAKVAKPSEWSFLS